MQIFEFIDIDHVEILLGKLQIKFDKEKFEKYTTEISKSEKKNDEKQIEILKENNESKDEEKLNSEIKINSVKGKSKSNLKNKKKELLTNIENGNEEKGNSKSNVGNHFEIIKSPSKIDDYNLESGKNELPSGSGNKSNRQSPKQIHKREEIKEQNKINDESEKEERRDIWKEYTFEGNENTNILEKK